MFSLWQRIIFQRKMFWVVCPRPRHPGMKVFGKFSQSPRLSAPPLSPRPKIFLVGGASAAAGDEIPLLWGSPPNAGGETPLAGGDANGFGGDATAKRGAPLAIGGAPLFIKLSPPDAGGAPQTEKPPPPAAGVSPPSKRGAPKTAEKPPFSPKTGGFRKKHELKQKKTTKHET